MAGTENAAPDAEPQGSTPSLEEPPRDLDELEVDDEVLPDHLDLPTETPVEDAIEQLQEAGSWGDEDLEPHSG